MSDDELCQIRLPQLVQTGSRMRICIARPLFVLVTGLARSGTTVLASLLNSADNAVILSEPHNSLHKSARVAMDKLGTRGERRMGPWKRARHRFL